MVVISASLACGALARPGRAEEPRVAPALSVLVLCQGLPGCAQSVERMRGQTVELPVRLLVGAPPPVGALERELGAAEAARAAQHADIALWWRVPAAGGEGEPEVAVWTHAEAPAADERRGRLLLRPLPLEAAGRARGSELGTAAREASALILRGAVEALRAGVPAGEPRQAPPEAAAPAPPPPPSMGEPMRSPWAVVGGVALQGAWDGVPPEPGFGLQLDGAVQWRWLRAGVFGARSTADVGTSSARGVHTRGQVGGFVGATIWTHGRWAAGVQLRGGFHLTQVEPRTGPYRDVATFWRRVVGAGLEGRLAVIPRRWAFRLGAGLDWVNDPPAITEVGETSRRLLWRIAALQPFLLLGTEISWP